MKKKINIILGIIILILAAILVYMLIIRQGNSSEPIDNTTPIETSTPEPTPELTEAPHEHVYTETINTEATCTTDGLKTLTCECGDTYTEPIIAMGHVFGEYIYNGDATYFADGTQTAQCKHCEATDTGTAYQSKLQYTFEYMDKFMYAQQTVNVRDMPCEDGEKLGSLSTNEEVYVTGQCIETGWYEIECIAGYRGYVSDSYLGTSKVSTSNSGGGNTSSQTQSYTFIAPNGDVITASRPITWEDIAPSQEGFLYTNNTDIVIYINGDRCSPGGSTLKLMDGGDGGPLTGDTVIKPAGD